jgi:hypothetical protein
MVSVAAPGVKGTIMRMGRWGQAPWAMAGLAKAALVKPSNTSRRCMITAGCLSVCFIRENARPRFKKSLGLTKRRGTYELTLQGESVP